MTQSCIDILKQKEKDLDAYCSQSSADSDADRRWQTGCSNSTGRITSAAASNPLSVSKHQLCCECTVPLPSTHFIWTLSNARAAKSIDSTVDTTGADHLIQAISAAYLLSKDKVNLIGHNWIQFKRRSTSRQIAFGWLKSRHRLRFVDREEWGRKKVNQIKPIDKSGSAMQLVLRGLWIVNS